MLSWVGDRLGAVRGVLQSRASSLRCFKESVEERRVGEGSGGRQREHFTCRGEHRVSFPHLARLTGSLPSSLSHQLIALICLIFARRYLNTARRQLSLLGRLGRRRDCAPSWSDRLAHQQRRHGMRRTSRGSQGGRLPPNLRSQCLRPDFDGAERLASHDFRKERHHRQHRVDRRLRPYTVGEHLLRYKSGCAFLE